MWATARSAEISEDLRLDTELESGEWAMKMVLFGGLWFSIWQWQHICFKKFYQYMDSPLLNLGESSSTYNFFKPLQSFNISFTFLIKYSIARQVFELWKMNTWNMFILNYQNIWGSLEGKKQEVGGICCHPEPSPPATVGVDPVQSLGRHFLGMNRSTMWDELTV